MAFLASLLCRQVLIGVDGPREYILERGINLVVRQFRRIPGGAGSDVAFRAGDLRVR